MRKLMTLLVASGLLFSCTKELPLRVEKGGGKPTKKYYPKTSQEFNSIAMRSGDSVFLTSGLQYSGSLVLSGQDVGAWIGTRGEAKAIVVGNGTGYGLDIKGKDLKITNLDVSNFNIGAAIQSSGISLSQSEIHHNKRAGIESWGNWPRYSLQNIYVGYVKAHNNRGDFGTGKHSGNGILLGGVDGGLIEHCETYENGADNRGPSGPVGQWMYDSKNVTIRNGYSHHNRAGLDKDGGGFDIDGGSQNCVIENCISEENEGAGYGAFEYGSPNAFTNNIIRNNTSRNDGTKNGYQALSLWGVDAAHSVTNTQIYGNTFYNKGVQLIGSNFLNVSITNNTFYGVLANEPAVAGVTWSGNQYR